jgi:hypothetical protein
MKGIDILVILDRSGSMQTGQKDHEGGLRSFVEDQKGLDGEVWFTMAQFDTQDPCEILFDRVPIRDVDTAKIVLIPRGGTPLHDAVGRAISHLEAKTNGNQTIVMVITDGEENSSKEWTKARVKERVAALEAKGWTFLFLGANIDAFHEGGQIGVAVATTANYSDKTPGSINAMYGTLSNKLGAVRMASARGMSVGASAMNLAFTKEEADEIQVGSSVAFDGGVKTFTNTYKDAADLLNSTTGSTTGTVTPPATGSTTPSGDNEA